METHPTTQQQEILLMTGTSFASRQCLEEDTQNPGRLTEKEQLEQACWNGMVAELLPELTMPVAGSKKIYLWNVTEADAFLELDLGEFPAAKDRQFSIDPYCFLEMQPFN